MPFVKTIYALLLLSMFIFMADPSYARPAFDLQSYQRNDGAITTHFNGDFVDPYFSSKALLVAKQLKLDISKASQSWINWLLAQDYATPFYRFCINKEKYLPCQIADADDAALAVWVELITNATPTRPPTAWLKSWRQSYTYLFNRLYDRKRNIYFISLDNKVSLLMDNVEVYSALLSMRDYFNKTGDSSRASFLSQKASHLRTAIIDTFWQQEQQQFIVSTQIPNQKKFYPDLVAQIFPLLADIHPPHMEPKSYYKQWMDQHRATWLSQGRRDYPWGLITLIAIKYEDYESVDCWLHYASRLRHGAHWNILEEAIFQGIKKNRINQLVDDSRCA